MLFCIIDIRISDIPSTPFQSAFQSQGLDPWRGSLKRGEYVSIPIVNKYLELGNDTKIWDLDGDDEVCVKLGS